MSEFRTITVSKGPGGYGGPLAITPDEYQALLTLARKSLGCGGGA